MYKLKYKINSWLATDFTDDKKIGIRCAHSPNAYGPMGGFYRRRLGPSCRITLSRDTHSYILNVMPAKNFSDFTDSDVPEGV
jgi:hypothetical protein